MSKKRACMRIASSEGRAFFALQRIDRESTGDVQARVRVNCAGFRGSNQSVWFERPRIDSFLSDLSRLEERRQGVATLEAMSPDECHLTLRSADRLGHIHVEVAIGRYIFLRGVTDQLHCRARFEIDPSVLPIVVADAYDELRPKIR